jgi:hypothetical protein
MTTLTDLSKAANTRMVAAQIHHSERAGGGQAAAFNADIDRIAAQYKTQMDNLHSLDGTSVTSAKAAIDTLVTAVKVAGPVVPSAA